MFSMSSRYLIWYIQRNWGDYLRARRGLQKKALTMWWVCWTARGTKRSLSHPSVSTISWLCFVPRAIQASTCLSWNIRAMSLTLVVFQQMLVYCWATIGILSHPLDLLITDPHQLNRFKFKSWCLGFYQGTRMVSWRQFNLGNLRLLECLENLRAASASRPCYIPMASRKSRHLPNSTLPKRAWRAKSSLLPAQAYALSG